MVHAKQSDEIKLKQVCKELKKTRDKDGNSSKTSLWFKTSQDSRGFPTKVLLILQGSTKLKCLPLIPKTENVVVLMLRILFVQSVVKTCRQVPSWQG